MIPSLVKLIEYWVSAANIWFNPCISSLPRIRIYFPLLSICTDELISTPKTKFLPTLPSSKEYCPRVSNTIPKPPYEHLSGSVFLVNLTPPNKQPPKVKSVFKSRDHESNSETRKLPHFLEYKLSCFIFLF